MNTRHAERVEGCGSPVETSARSAEAPTEPAGETKSFCPCQKETVTVLVTVSFWYLDGEPKHSIVAISTMWVKESAEIFQIWEREYQTMIDALHPQKIFIYGKIPSNVKHENIERIEKFSEKRWSGVDL